MPRTSILSVFTLLLSAINATPLDTNTRATNDIQAKCSNAKITAYWFKADCLADDGITKISSATYLGNKVGNSDGYLKV